uniref:BPTI/Kunitz inhibitor domain-containing protein n=1 Tax=Megaselia scalaris TaxID=36166 RepID=T1GZ17_MEGSC
MLKTLSVTMKVLAYLIAILAIFSMVTASIPTRCKLRRVTGPCKASHRRYFYNYNLHKCQSFNYGGCQGNLNNFHSIEDCIKVCMK